MAKIFMAQMRNLLKWVSSATALTTTKNVGIGMTAPTSLLHISGTNNGAINMKIQNLLFYLSLSNSIGLYPIHYFNSF